MTAPQSSSSGSELLPCPFCGGKAELNEFWEENDEDAPEHASIEFVVVRCTQCGISKEKRDQATGILWWNARGVAQAERTYSEVQVAEAVEKVISGMLDRGEIIRGPSVPSTSRVTVSEASYCALCDLEHQLHEDAQGFHHVIKGERVVCPLSSTEGKPL